MIKSSIFLSNILLLNWKNFLKNLHIPISFHQIPLRINKNFTARSEIFINDFFLYTSNFFQL